MTRADQHIEFAHIYADMDFGTDQLKSILHARKIVSSLPGRTTAAVLVDDLHVDKSSLKIHSFLSSVQSAGIRVDHIAFESRFDVVAEEIISALPEWLLSLETFRKSNRKVLNLVVGERRIGLKTFDDAGEVHTCALLSAAWSLCRLGVYPFPEGSLWSFNEAPVIARRAISVLHQSFSPIEDKVREIIRVAGHAERLSSLTHHFYQ